MDVLPMRKGAIVLDALQDDAETPVDCADDIKPSDIESENANNPDDIKPIVIESEFADAPDDIKPSAIDSEKADCPDDIKPSVIETETVADITVPPSNEIDD